jgi:hypothetical protein
VFVSFTIPLADANEELNVVMLTTLGGEEGRRDFAPTSTLRLGAAMGRLVVSSTVIRTVKVKRKRRIRTVKVKRRRKCLLIQGLLLEHPSS